jgi:trimeric autotransporter adhesin
MRPNKQVSFAIRILREKRDASARATHLEAANKKYLLTTNERKQMSTTTNFKRIALVAVAALGLGVLSSVPSNAVVGAGTSVVLTTTNGSATTSTIDSTTAGTVKVRWLATTATDSVIITTSLNSKPALATTSPSLIYVFSDTLTSISPAVTYPAFGTDDVTLRGLAAVSSTGKADTAVVTTTTTAGYTSGTWKAQLDTTSAIVAGTYTYTVTATPYGAATGVEATKAVSAEISIVVSALTSNSTTAAAAYSTAYIGSTSVDSSTAADSTSLSFPGTASATAAGAIWVKLRNASNGAVETLDSLTVTIDKGNVGSAAAGSLGKSIVLAYAPSSGTGGMQVRFYPDGSVGTATITIATKNAGTFTKSVTWYGTDYKSIVASSYRSVIAVGSEGSKGAVKVNAYDVNSNSYGAATTVYAYSSDTTVISNYGVTACTWNTTDLAAYCALTGLKAGTANITFRDAATVAASTVVSNAVAVRVSAGVATSFTLTTDKASYAPGEKGYVIVTVKDAAGLVMPALSSATVFASGGITTNGQLGVSSDTTTATVFSTDRSSTPSSTDPIKAYAFYAPASAGTVTFSAKGASTYSAASQATATTTTITVADNASAALAAVSALAVTVASLKTLITTLTNLVLKIQKKVKA